MRSTPQTALTESEASEMILCEIRFPEQMEALDEIDHELKSLDGSNTNVAKLQDLRQEVMLELERQCSSAPSTQADLDELMEKLEDQKTWVMARKEALRE